MAARVSVFPDAPLSPWSSHSQIMAAIVEKSVIVLSFPWVVVGLLMMGILAFVISMAPCKPRTARSVITFQRKLEIIDKVEADIPA